MSGAIQESDDLVCTKCHNPTPITIRGLCPNCDMFPNELPAAPGNLAQTPGYKLDVDKLRYDLIPPYALEALAYVYTVGAKKYGDDNYLKGMSYRRVFGALLRHAFAWLKGRSIDPEDGQHPLASVAWCAFALMEYERLGVGVDDRRK